MNPTFALVLGLILGLALAAGVGVGALRARMIAPRRSRRSFDDTCAAIERVVPADPEGWSLPLPAWDAFPLLEKKGLAPENLRGLRFFFVCNPRYASGMLRLEPSFAGMMPCTWAVYEKQDGSVWLAKMNVGLLGRLFPPAIAAIMGRVAAADERFLAEILG